MLGVIPFIEELLGHETNILLCTNSNPTRYYTLYLRITWTLN